MEEIISLGVVGLVSGVLIASELIKGRKKRKRERSVVMAELAKVEAWQERLERAKAERERHPEDYVPGGVELPSYVR